MPRRKALDTSSVPTDMSVASPVSASSLSPEVGSKTVAPKTKQIVSHIANRQAFFELLRHNTGLVLLKMGAPWCGPCRAIEHQVHEFFASSPDTVICCDINIDECFDVYSYFKSKKMVYGIPVILCFKKGNVYFTPDDMVTGGNPADVHEFCLRCNQHLLDAVAAYPEPTLPPR